MRQKQSGWLRVKSTQSAKAELLDLASGWRQCAVNYEYVQKLENFLKTFKAPDGPLSAH